MDRDKVDVTQILEQAKLDYIEKKKKLARYYRLKKRGIYVYKPKFARTYPNNRAAYKR
jgi:hypothetical protein